MKSIVTDSSYITGGGDEEDIEETMIYNDDYDDDEGEDDEKLETGLRNHGLLKSQTLTSSPIRKKGNVRIHALIKSSFVKCLIQNYILVTFPTATESLPASSRLGPKVVRTVLSSSSSLKTIPVLQAATVSSSAGILGRNLSLLYRLDAVFSQMNRLDKNLAKFTNVGPLIIFSGTLSFRFKSSKENYCEESTRSHESSTESAIKDYNETEDSASFLQIYFIFTIRSDNEKNFIAN